MTVQTPQEFPQQVGVVGGGRMGSGIAHAFLICGSSVTIVEADAAAAGRARAAVESALDAGIARGKINQDREVVLGRLSVDDSISGLHEVDLVIEAVPEIVAVKIDVLTAVARRVAAEAVIASNTSSMSIGELGMSVAHPERFLGLHFFNPVPSSKLVEIVIGPQTDTAVVHRAQQWVADLGKAAVTVTDSPGFASSRLGLVLGLEAIRMLQDGVGSAEDIDTAMTLGYGHPMGPLKLTDLVGLDVRLGIADYLHRTLGDRFAPPELLREKVSRGELGRKTGQGFYHWTD